MIGTLGSEQFSNRPSPLGNHIGMRNSIFGVALSNFYLSNDLHLLPKMTSVKPRYAIDPGDPGERFRYRYVQNKFCGKAFFFPMLNFDFGTKTCAA